MEHTTSREIAQKIALDHLAEYPDYYDALAAMERNLKARHDAKHAKYLYIAEEPLSHLVRHFSRKEADVRDFHSRWLGKRGPRGKLRIYKVRITRGMTMPTVGKVWNP